MDPRFFERRFVVLSGKGGVGRSTVCAAIALAAAERGKRVLVCELNTQERIPALFGAPPTGPRIGPVAPGIDSVNIRPDDAMREYGLMKLHFRALYRAAFENRVVSAFLRLIPGLPELLLLGKAYYHEAEKDPATGRPRWDMIVVDSPATGHGVPLLRIPQVILSITDGGPMAEDARAMRSLLTDPKRTSLNLVTLPESMPVSEAIHLKQQVDEILQIPTGYLFINQVHQQLFNRPGQKNFELLRTGYDGDEALPKALLVAGRKRMHRTRLESSHIQRARAAISLPTVEIPHVFSPAWGPDEVGAVSRSIIDGIGAHEARR